MQGGKGETPVLRTTGGVQADYSGVQWSTSGVKRSTAEYGGVQQSTADYSGVRVEYKWSTSGVQAEYSGVQVEYKRSTGGVQWSTSGVREVRWTTGVPESRLFPLALVA